MKPEPLEGKVWCVKHEDKTRSLNCKWVCNEVDVASAVEWLKRELWKIESPPNPHKWLDSEEVYLLINKAFVDVVKDKEVRE